VRYSIVSTIRLLLLLSSTHPDCHAVVLGASVLHLLGVGADSGSSRRGRWGIRDDFEGLERRCGRLCRLSKGVGAEGC